MLFLQLETALADARASVEKAGEALHDASVQAAQRKAEYEAQTATVRRLEGALSALHGDGPKAATPVPAPERRPRAPKLTEGPVCSGCGEVGKLVRQGPLVVCTACQAQTVA